MNTRSTSIRLLSLAFAAFGLAVTARGAVTMQLDQAEIHQDQSAQLTVNATGNGADQLTPPVVPGLEFTATNQSSQVEVINGAVTANSSVTYEVTAQRPGTYVIPSLDSSGKSLTLRVLAGSAPGTAAPMPGQPASNTSLPAPIMGNSTSGTTQTAQGPAFIRMDLPKRELFVGETVPVKIQIGLRAGLQPSLNGLPTLTADAFTLNKLSDKPQQTEEEIDGRPYLILTWNSTLAAIKPGDFPLEITAPVTIEERTQTADGDDDSMFGGSIFQNLFGAVTKKNLALSSTLQPMHVLALPTRGQPANFSGAVGNFQMSSSVSPSSAAAGDPLTLRMQIKGSGDFDRLDSSMLPSSSEWKTYGPTSKFTPADSVGYSGEKDFEQAVIPEHSGHQNVPALTFSFFNPDSRQYETLHSEPSTVDITPGTSPIAQSPAPTTSPVAWAPVSTPADGMRPDEVENGSRLRTIEPLFFQPGFLLGQGIVALGFLTAGTWARRRERIASDPNVIRRHQHSQAVGTYLRKMDAAASRRDTLTFFLAAKRALQHCLGPRWNIAPDAVTAVEIEALLNGKGENARRVFDLADQLTYSNGEGVEADFQAWKASVHQLVEQAETL